MDWKKAKTIPEFPSEAEEADWWGTHDTSEIWRTANRAKPITLPPEQVKFIHARATALKQAISIRLDHD